MSWWDTLLPATLGGAPFLMRTAEREGGRRVAVFEYPGRDTPDAEDLGRRKRVHRIEGAVIGDDALIQAQALDLALDAKGPLVLSHPVHGVLTVCVSGPTRTRVNLNFGRIVEFSFELTELSPATPAPTAPTSLADTAAAIAAAVGALAREVESAVTAAMSFAAPILGTGMAVVGGALAAAAGSAAGGAGLLAVAPGLGSTLAAAGGSLSAAIPSGPSAWVAAAAALIGAIAAAGSTVDSAAGNQASAAASWALWPPPQAAAQVPYTPSTAPAWSAALPAFNTLVALAGWSPSLATIPQTTPTRLQQSANQAAAVLLVQASAAGAAAALIPVVPWTSRDQATTARDALVAAIDSLGDQAGDLSGSLDDLRAAAVTDINARAASLPALRAITLPSTQSSTLVAYGLDGDALTTLFSRAADLAARNGVANPAFVPGGVALEVLNA